jgi:hypothetical protein
MRKLFVLIASISLLSSCAKKKPIIYENDTDFKEWINQQTVKNVPNPHSGFSASVIDSAHNYSLGFSKPIENISNDKFKEVEVSYWVFAKSDQAKANTVFSVDFNGKNVDWSGRAVPFRKDAWTEVKETYKISDKAQPNNQLSVYVWNTSKEELLIDDFKLRFK